jgi:hypothetical protein
MALPILCLAFSACSKPDARAAAADPNTPAVVRAPQPTLPGDTEKKVVEPIINGDDARMVLSRDYALEGAGLSNLDPKLIEGAYAPDAQLTTPNGKFTGAQAIVKEFQSFGMDGSVKEFNRQSFKLSVIDSTVVDTGTYFVTRKKGAGQPVTEHGAYAAVWRIHPAPLDWVMTKDHLYPVSKKK